MKKRANKSFKKSRRRGYVLKVTEKVIEWQPETSDQKQVDEIFQRLLPRFGWTQNKSGQLEHVGLDPYEDAR